MHFYKKLIMRNIKTKSPYEDTGYTSMKIVLLFPLKVMKFYPIR